jgi:hypothetical protein
MPAENKDVQARAKSRGCTDRRDRYLRASDHVSFQGQGYPAARFTEPRENFNHEHQDVKVVGAARDWFTRYLAG